MNRPIRNVAIFTLALFLSLMGKATYIQFVQSDSLADRDDNVRISEAAYSAQRGDILVGNLAIASSTPVDDQFEYLRQYKPRPFVYAPITGYFTRESSTGIENTENSVLTGDDPRLFVRRLVDLVSNKQQRGGNVRLTLNAKAQLAAYNGLKALGPGTEGSVVALEPGTGKVLAMVSYPSYDPNQLASHDFDKVGDNYDRLLKADGDPLINRAIRTRLFPGSTFKLVTAAAAIESGKYSSADDLVPAGPSYTPPGTSRPIHNEAGLSCGTGRIPFAQAMENSCNTTFAPLAVEVGAEGMLRQAEKFGFNDHYFDDLAPGQVESVFPSDLSTDHLAQAGFGQYEVQATPLQMAMVAAGIANEGVVMKPHLVQEIQSADLDGHTVDDEEYGRAVSPHTAQVLTDLLVATVDHGTASPAAIPGVSVAGKTGTAQSGVEGKAAYAWFTSFAPATNAKVAVAVMIEKAPSIENSEIAGGRLGGPIAKAVMEAVLDR